MRSGRLPAAWRARLAFLLHPSFGVLLMAAGLAVFATSVVLGDQRRQPRLPSTDLYATAAPTARPLGAERQPTPAPTLATVQSAPKPRVAGSPYRWGGRSYAGLSVPPGTVLLAPFGGAAEIRVYQLIGGEVRVGSNFPTLPFFPYVSVASPERRITYRPGAFGEVELLVENGATVAEGAPLFRVTGSTRSSWATFYDASVPFQVVVSLQSLPDGRDLDALGLIRSD